MFRHAFPVVATCLTLIASTTPVQAQQVAGSFDELRMHIKAGDTVTVTEMSGQTIRGKVSQLSASSLGLAKDNVRRTFTEPDVITIRHGDNSAAFCWAWKCRSGSAGGSQSRQRSAMCMAGRVASLADTARHLSA